jgi:hypothetical protein
MTLDRDALFNKPFLATLQSLVELHHSIYPRIPPQGVFFESLVEQAFKRVGWSAEQVVLSTANTPKYDLLVGTHRLSIKTETGIGTRPDSINITKLCTTETGDWNSASLIQHTLKHLARYDYLLILRAIWPGQQLHYQLLEIPLAVLKSIAAVTVLPVGRRTGRSSMAADVYNQAGKAFRVHFDGADGKCQIHRLALDRGRLLLEWDQPLEQQ